MQEEDEDLSVFNQKYSDVLEHMADKINPSESRDITKRRNGIGRILDIAILIRKGFGQAWQFISMITSIYIILGLSEQVSHALSLLGIMISPFQIGLLAVGSMGFFVCLGMVMLLYGGSQRSQYLINLKQNPAQRMDYVFYKETAKKLIEIDKRLEQIESGNYEGKEQE